MIGEPDNGNNSSNDDLDNDSNNNKNFKSNQPTASGPPDDDDKNDGDHSSLTSCPMLKPDITIKEMLKSFINKTPTPHTNI